MAYIFKGRLCGYLCSDYSEPISTVTVRLYRLAETRPTEPTPTTVKDLVDAREKFTLAVLPVEIVERKSKLLIAEAQTDADGNFEVTLSQDYKGEPFEVDVYMTRAPGQKQTPKRPPVQFTITTLQPAWKGERDFYWDWEYCLPVKFWCYVRGLLDAWVIYGHVVACANQQQPIGGVLVKAFDADWITDDFLGSDTTNSSGFFRIDYTSIDFKQTFLSPWGVFIETPFPPYNSGPDVYFKVESGTTTLLNETRPDGHKPGRENVGHCLCVTLCADIPVPPVDTIPTAWTKVGNAFTIPAGAVLHSFDANGYAGANKYALTSTVRLLGSAPISQGGNEVEYRFRVSNTTAANGAPSLAESNFTRIVGIGADSALFAQVEVGQLIRYAPYTVLNVVAVQSDLDAQGWLNVNRCITRTFNDNSIPLVDRPNFLWIDEDALMAIDTTALTTQPNVPAAAADAGQAIPSGNLISVEKFAVRFDVRLAGVMTPRPGNGTTLNAMVVNNNPIFLKVAMQEHQLGSPCGELSGNVHVAYTVYHPHLGSASLHINSNDYSINTDLADAPRLPYSSTVSLAPTLNNPSLSVNPPLVLHKCTYLVTLNGQPRLHTGDGAASNVPVQTTFFWQ